MAQSAVKEPIRTLRGTWDEILAHSDEIPRASEVEVKVFAQRAKPGAETSTMALMRSWIEQDATDDPEEVRAAEDELLEFKRNMNKPRKDAGARVLYPEVESD